MQFQVPQFTDIEDRVIGPLTLKQFMYLLIGGVALFILYKLVNVFVFFILAMPIGAITFAFAFVKIHNQPFGNIVKNFLGFLKKPDFYIWKKPTGRPKTEEKRVPEIIQKAPPTKKIKPISKQKLQEIGWKVEIEK